MAQGYLLFHLNLAFSSINTDAHPEVIKKCYWPLLELVKQTGYPVGIELTGWTLKQIENIDPAWVERFKGMLANDECELIGSGWSQIIGPLVPYEVNVWNQRLGTDAYKAKLGVIPRIALVNEMAYSSGLVDVYAEAGYKGIVMDRDNIRLALGLDHYPISSTPTHALSPDGNSLSVLWSDSILFQRLQRVVHGDIPIKEYEEYIIKRCKEDRTIIPIYCNDAEIFDYRPGRFTAESILHPDGEWERMFKVLKRLQNDVGIEFVSPYQALRIHLEDSEEKHSTLSTIQHPIPVKKQAKYNINRWAVTGRNDLWLNTMCHKIFNGLKEKGVDDQNNWQSICEIWSSDLRTHITEERWQEALRQIDGMLDRHVSEQKVSTFDEIKEYEMDCKIEKDEEGILWKIMSEKVHLVLNARRGLAIKSLAFKKHDFQPIIGTLSQGYFRSIKLGADFYSGGFVVDLPGKRYRHTDLEWVQPRVERIGSALYIISDITIGDMSIEKKIYIELDKGFVGLEYDFSKIPRPVGIVRAGSITLLPESWDTSLYVSTKNGGRNIERFIINKECAHGDSVTTFVSSSSGFGATNGTLKLYDKKGRSLSFQWDPSLCAAIPILTHKHTQGSHLTRLIFSLSEIDDTMKENGNLLCFGVKIMPSS